MSIKFLGGWAAEPQSLGVVELGVVDSYPDLEPAEKEAIGGPAGMTLPAPGRGGAGPAWGNGGHGRLGDDTG